MGTIRKLPANEALSWLVPLALCPCQRNGIGGDFWGMALSLQGAFCEVTGHAFARPAKGHSLIEVGMGAGG